MTFAFRFAFALCLAAGLLVATQSTALANFGTGCDKQTGQPYAWAQDFTPYVGQNFQVYADGQRVAQGTFSSPEGNGFAAFGQPGVAYTNVTLALPDGGTVALGDINCPPPAGGGQGDTGQTAPQLACIEVKPASALQSRDFTRLAARGGASTPSASSGRGLSGASAKSKGRVLAVIHTIA